MNVQLVKKTVKKDDKEFVNLYIITEDGVKVPIQVKKFGKTKQDYFRECTLRDNAEEL